MTQRGEPASSPWSGRVDAFDGARGRRWHQVVRSEADSDGPGIALLGFASDAGVHRNHGRTGAVEGPVVLRRALSNLAWHGDDDARLYDAGNVTCSGDRLEDAQSAYAGRLAALLGEGHFPIGLGGGHEIAWASYQGIERAFPRDPCLEHLGIINFDAHLDLRRPETAGRGTSGTPFFQIAESRAARGLPFRYFCLGACEATNTPALLDRAHELGVSVVYDVESTQPAVQRQLRDFIEQSSAIYLTFCLDVLPASAAPGVSAPAGLGVPLHRAVELLRDVVAMCGHRPAGGKLLAADVAELNPRHDPDGRTARVAARLVYEMAAVHR